VREAGQTAETTSTRREALAESFRRLPAFLGQLEPFMGRLGDLAKAQQPVLRDLGAASGDLDTFLTRLRPFAEAGTPAFEALGNASVVGRRAVLASDEEIQELRRLGTDAPGLAKPLRQFLQTIDDRKRAVEPDERAAATDPPAPDKTHISGSGGFTGMEALWNYFYWQALSTNALDNVGHVLRLSIVVALQCTSYAVKSGTDVAKIPCNQYLGPTQPGVTTPDPTKTSTSATTASQPASSSAGATPPAASAPADIPAPPGLLDYLLAP
jgi:hypothetical protein